MKSVASVLAAMLAAAIVLGAAAVVLAVPTWIIWSLGASIVLMWLACGNRLVPAAITGIAIAAAALYFGAPAVLGMLARGFIQ